MLTVQKDASVSVADLIHVGSALIDLKSAQLQQKVTPHRLNLCGS
jgi:hypothetical protein